MNYWANIVLAHGVVFILNLVYWMVVWCFLRLGPPVPPVRWHMTASPPQSRLCWPEDNWECINKYLFISFSSLTCSLEINVRVYDRACSKGQRMWTEVTACSVFALARVVLDNHTIMILNRTWCTAACWSWYEAKHGCLLYVNWQWMGQLCKSQENI